MKDWAERVVDDAFDTVEKRMNSQTLGENIADFMELAKRLDLPDAVVLQGIKNLTEQHKRRQH